MRKIVLYRLGLVAILSGGIGFMTVAVDHKSEVITPRDLEGLKGPVHTLEEISAPREQTPSNWI